MTDRETLLKMAEANGRAADPLKGAAAGILILGDLDRAFPPAKDYWVIDGAIAGQNMVLTAHALGIGSVWLGTWPQMERVEAQRKLFALPEHLVPHSILALGYEDGEAGGNLRPPKKEEPWTDFVPSTNSRNASISRSCRRKTMTISRPWVASSPPISATSQKRESPANGTASFSRC